MREMDNSVKLNAELSTSDSKFRSKFTIIILVKRVIDLEFTFAREMPGSLS